MPVSEPYKAIFVHIPKTGGTSIEFALGMHGAITDIGIQPYQKQQKDYHTLFGKGLQHLTAVEIFYIISTRSNKRFSASGIYLKILRLLNLKIIIHELQKISKDYYVFTIVRNPYDRLVSQLAWSEGKWFEGKQLEIDLFRESTKRIFSRPPNRIPERLKPQYTYIFFKENKLVDDVYHYEDFKAVSTRLNTRFNLHVEIPLRMKSYHLPWEEYYNEELKEMVSDYYHKDFKLFGYEK